jgi:hypothetical protein
MSWGVQSGKSSMPLGDMKALKPSAPAAARARSARGRRALAGTSPAHRPTSTNVLLGAAAARCLARTWAGVVVQGAELSGMSTTAVTPPAAAARVALAIPSHASRPGSFM